MKKNPYVNSFNSSIKYKKHSIEVVVYVDPTQAELLKMKKEEDEHILKSGFNVNPNSLEFRFVVTGGHIFVCGSFFAEHHDIETALDQWGLLPHGETYTEGYMDIDLKNDIPLNIVIYKEGMENPWVQKYLSRWIDLPETIDADVAEDLANAIHVANRIILKGDMKKVYMKWMTEAGVMNLLRRFKYMKEYLK